MLAFSRIVLSLVCLSASLVVGTATAQENTKKLFVWEISSKTNKIYLAGSVHLGFEGLYPLPKEIEKAFANSQKLAVEVNVDNIPGFQILKILAQGTYKGGKTLTSEVSQETAKKLKDYCEANNVPIKIVNRYKPWMASMLLTELMAKKAGFDMTKGLEKHFLKKARKTGKTVLELESMKLQLELFVGFDKGLQERMLLDTLSDAKDYKKVIDRIFAAWKTGDLEKMHKIAILDPQKVEPKLKTLYVKMFDERNVKMTEKIEGYLKGDDIVFVLVGSGHIPGEKGILKLLRDKGYKIRQVTRMK
ncbi:MAG: TraB/GumN family protein [Gemmataceae bacterium]